MAADIPQPVQLVLSDYGRLLHEATPGLLAGLYLHGSVALGAFKPGLSDVDFIAITSRPCTPRDLDTLRALHHTLSEHHPAPPLEGSYLQWADLGQSEGTLPPRPYIHDGVFHAEGHHDINAVTWWVLKQHGIAVVGPAPEHLALPVDWGDLIAKMHENLNSYWVSFTTHPPRMAWLLTDYGIQWTVLGVLRQFYSFREQDIISKSDAGRYGLAHTPRRWHALIQEAIAIRESGGPSSYRFRAVRALDAWAFLRFIISQCNKARR